MEKIINLISQLESKIPFQEKTNPSVSNATVGWQIEHSLKTILLIIETVKKSNPDNYKWKFNKNKLFISIIGFIPRGKAKAPKVVLPDENIKEEILKDSLEKVKTALKDWEKLDKNAHFPHPYFGNLNKKSTEWFLYLHTNHHLKIANDICK
ncbi:DUF1569 domain-containing protein [Flavobacterium sp. SUN052]|uniref:DUF1569 domain-containing protein n=1 Tax=Flavobacterium sp. SUN052 TaxID=3002441 RepID=UPI00237D5FA5|nr:DUF1569 domain-containing protein [Flavobacterium sp. SUN052]MEC4004332.1 DUF1569 domain-containing protein [Flavobacterium sp. SUN052]